MDSVTTTQILFTKSNNERNYYLSLILLRKADVSWGGALDKD